MHGRMLTLVADREEVVVAHLPSDGDAVAVSARAAPPWCCWRRSTSTTTACCSRRSRRSASRSGTAGGRPTRTCATIILGESTGGRRLVAVDTLPPDVVGCRPDDGRRMEALEQRVDRDAPARGSRQAADPGRRPPADRGRSSPSRSPTTAARSRASRWATRRSSSARSRLPTRPGRRSRRSRRSAAPRSSTAPPTSSPSASRSSRSQMTLETGNAIWETRMEVRRTVEILRGAAEESRRITGEQIPIDGWPNGEGRYAMTRRFPVGPVLGITPFNAPLLLVAHKLAPALAAGCPCIIRPASKTPLSALSLGEIVLEAGAPPAARQRRPVPDRAGRGAWRGTSASRPSPSPAAARSAGTCAASRAPHRITLELGGNGAVIVHEDANVAYAAKRVRLRRLPALRAGLHLRAAPVRPRVHRRGVRAALVGEIEGMALGDPSDDATIIGCLVDERAADAAMAVIEEARAAGARVALRRRPASARRASRRPCSRTSRRPRGPAPRRSSPRSWPSPRTATWTPRSPPPAKRFTACRRASSRMICESSSAPIQQLEVGGVIVNDVNTYRVDHMPYGGERRSGSGREGVRFAIRDFTQERLLVVDPR